MKRATEENRKTRILPVAPSFGFPRQITRQFFYPAFYGLLQQMKITKRTHFAFINYPITTTVYSQPVQNHPEKRTHFQKAVARTSSFCLVHWIQCTQSFQIDFSPRSGSSEESRQFILSKNAATVVRAFGVSEGNVENPKIDSSYVCRKFFPPRLANSTYSRSFKAAQALEFFFADPTHSTAYPRHPESMSPLSYRAAVLRPKTGHKCPENGMPKKGKKLPT